MRSRALYLGKWFIVFACLSCVVSVARAAEEPRYQTGPVPSWVEEVKVPEKDSGDFGKSSSSMHYLLVDEQAEAGLAASYFHYAYEVLSESGLDGASEISVAFDPSYESLTFHQIRRFRQGEWKEILPQAKIQVMQREKEMEYQLLDGSLTAVCHLEDVRVGDILEYSFSRQGAHPLMQGHFIDSNSLAWGIPVQEMTLRVVAPKNHLIQQRLYLEDGAVIREEAGENIIYRIRRSKLPAVLSENDAPSWHDQYAWVQWSDFQTWKDVVDWALPLYPVEEKLSAELQAEVDRISSKTQDGETRVREALQFVQSQIRYLGLEMGAGSHRPNPPELVLSRRFGDCKDKTLLLVTLLKALGVEAHPALVHTSERNAIQGRLPSPYCFNHVITQVVLAGGEELWLDPTRHVQYGKLKGLYVGNYGQALVIREGNGQLSSFSPRPESLPKVEVKENFKVNRPGEPVLLKVQTTYRGQLAESNRNYFGERSLTEAHKNSIEYYGKIYPAIRSTGEMRISDDKENNVLDVWEEYEIKDFWKKGKGKEKDGVWSAEFYPYEVENKLNETGKLDRQAPLRLNHPTHIVLKTELEMFEPWNLNQENFSIGNEFLKYTHTASLEKNLVYFNYEYQTGKDEVPVSQIKAYHEGLSKVKDSLGYTLTYDTHAAANKVSGPAQKINWPAVVITMLCLAVFFALALVLWIVVRKDPPLQKTSRSLDGLGGWLVLIAIGLMVSPVTIGVEFIKNFSWVYETERWNVLTSPGGSEYHALYAPLSILEMVYNLFLIVYYLWLIALFFSKRALFPKAMIGSLIMVPLMLVIDHFCMMQIPAYASTTSSYDLGRETGRYFLQALIWIPYFIVSKRVRATFRF
jgi:hypothetical protein